MTHRLTVAAITRETAVHFGVHLDEMLSESRGGDLSKARQLAMYLSHELLPSYPETQIARAFKRHPATIRHGRRQVEKRLAEEPELAVAVERIREGLGL